MLGRFANHVSMILASEIDEREVKLLFRDASDISTSLLGGREAAKYEPEMRLVTSLLYYGSSLLSYSGGMGSAGCATPGMSFCGLEMIMPKEKKESEGGGENGFVSSAQRFFYHGLFGTEEGGEGGSRRGSGRGESNTIFKRLDQRTAAFAVLFLSLLPYLNDRLADHTRVISDLIRDVTMSEEEEEVDAVVEANVLHDESQTPTTSSSSSLLLERVKTVLHGTWRTLSSSYVDGPGGRTAGLVSLFSDVHFFLFFLNAKYLQPALRLAGVRLMVSTLTARSRFNEPQLKNLAWLLGFRFALLAAYATRAFAEEVSATATATVNPVDSPAAESEIVDAHTGVFRQEDLPPIASANRDAIDVDAFATTTAAAGGESSSRSRISKSKCPLCMDPVQHASCTPCGHIYCWECIQGLSMQKSGRGRRRGAREGGEVTVAAFGSSKCPVCRAPFTPAQVRPLYNFN